MGNPLAVTRQRCTAGNRCRDHPADAGGIPAYRETKSIGFLTCQPEQHQGSWVHVFTGT